MPKSLLILGASARAAACSARRAGYVPIAGDAFGDVDLRTLCDDVELIDDYPRSLARFAQQAPAGPWMYTGGLENEPTLVDQVSRRRVLWGNSADVLRQVRDPGRLAATVERAGLRAPHLAATAADVPADGTWLSKPRASCGGGSIDRLDRPACDAAGRPSAGDRYFQQWIAGQSCAAVYVAARGNARLLGVTRQLTGVEWANAAGFQYAGSIGPLRLPAAQEQQFCHLGNCLAAEFRLIGLFGVDAILSGGAVWPVEVNPRYTASVEVLERAAGLHAIELHATACVDATVPNRLPGTRDKNAWCGKAIIYAPADVVVGEQFTRRLLGGGDGPWPCFADIPGPGTQIQAGQPVASVFAHGVSEGEVEGQLRQRAGDVRRWLGG